MRVTVDEVCRLVATQLGAELVNEGDRLIEDLGAESADVLNILAVVEERWGVVIDDIEAAEIRTVGDVHRRACEALKRD